MAGYSSFGAWVACAGVLSLPASVAAQAANAETPKASAPPPAETLKSSVSLPAEADTVVRGYRKSLEAALARKKRSTAQVDAIVAEDIADSPDPNLAESLQRLPGVSITRDAGEGARITARGLSGRYTRTRLNGMETRVGVGANTSREFDFNLFASELFSSIVVHKTANAELGEGSLGAVVDLNTGRPFGYKKGFTFVANAQGNINDFSATVRPRLVGLVGYHDPGGVWGATASAAYSLVRNDQEFSDTVRWHNGMNFRSVNGVVCADNPDDVGCAEVFNAFHARIPRYAETIHAAERVGLTAGLQYRPSARTEIRLDALYATYTQRIDLKTIEVLFRGNEGQMDVTNYTLEGHPVRSGLESSTLTALSVDNAWVRSETFRQDTESDYHQLTLAIDHQFSTNVSAHGLAGTSRSQGQIPRRTTLMYDNRNYDGYSYDYSEDTRFPRLTFAGPDVADGRNFTLTELRDRVHTTQNAFDTLDLRLNWQVVDALEIAVGVNYENMEFDTKESGRDGRVCDLGLADGTSIYDCDLDDEGLNAPGLLGPQGRPDFTHVTDYRGEVGVGSTTRWASPSLEGWTSFLNYYAVPLFENLAAVRTVREQTHGAFFQADGEVPLGSSGMRLLYNAGVRYVQTRQKSGGYLTWEFIEAERPMYDDWLPSASAALWLTSDLVVRLAAARVMARPELSDLSPGGNADFFNYRIDIQNPKLDPIRALTLDASTEWYFAEESLLSFALFLKKIDSFPRRQTRYGTFASIGLPPGLGVPGISPAWAEPERICERPEGCWEISELRHGEGATVEGLEVGFQAPVRALYGALPPVVRSLGFTGNLTLVGSNRKYHEVSSALENVDTFPDAIGLFNHSFNATLYYEDSKVGARLSVAHRSDYLVRTPSTASNLLEFVGASTRLDFSSSYNLLDELKVTFDAQNLSNTPFHSTNDSHAQRRSLYTRTGRNFLLGARYTY